MSPPWDVLVTGATVFDGSGRPPRVLDVAFAGRRVAATGVDLSPTLAREVVDGRGRWLTPGLLDIHTHYDLEVELDPGLPEAVRHGTTTVVVANCSLGLAFGHQRDPTTGQDPIVDCFARVENMPKHVLTKAADQATWRDSQGYLDHLDRLALGANVVPMIPHSMLRIEVMGTAAAVSRAPEPAELDRMTALLDQGMAEGYAGFSTDALPFHYLANDPHREAKIPSQHVQRRELRRLTDVVRAHGRVWQATPPKDDPLSILLTFLLSSGRLFGRPLKITAVAALDLVTNRSMAPLGLFLSRLYNSRLLQGHFRLQALAAPFKVWSEGPLTPLAEEVPELRALNEPDLEDRAARRAILRDPGFRERFVRMWTRGRRGWSFARLLRWLKRETVALTRELDDMVVEKAPVAAWRGESLGAIHRRLLAWQRTGEGARSDAERAAFEAAPDLRTEPAVGGDARLLLHLLEAYDTDLVWWTVTANADPRTTKRLLTHPLTLPGFNDSGAHLTNMAFHDANLRGLRMVQEDGEAAVARHVARLTAEPAELFGLIGVGRLEPGAQADAVLIDPERLAAWDPDRTVEEIHRDAYAHHQLVNRPPGVVQATWVGGKLAFADGAPTDRLGREALGRCLRAGAHPAPAVRPASAPVGEEGAQATQARFRDLGPRGVGEAPEAVVGAEGGAGHDGHVDRPQSLESQRHRPSLGEARAGELEHGVEGALTEP